jgi:hypothetical protein
LKPESVHGIEGRTIPPSPWRLKGTAVLCLRPIRIPIARRFVPEALRIVRVAPGVTLGALYCAQYEPSSTLPYHELIVCPAITRAARKTGFWISHIYVDDAVAAAGGRRIWGLEKQCASFDWSDEGRVSVTRDSARLCDLSWARRPRSFMSGLPLPLIARVLTHRNGLFQSFVGSGSGRARPCRASVASSAEDPLRALGFDASRSALLIERLRLRIRAPTSPAY